MIVFGVSCLRFSLLLLSPLWFCGTTQAQSCSPPTLESPILLSDADITKDTFPDGTKAKLQCETGYIFDGGSRFILCTAGTWGPTTMQCDKKTCGSPGDIQNGYFDITGTDFGDTATAICNDGYLMIGRGERHCMDGGWSGRIPVCEVVHCEPPPEVPNAFPYSPNKETYSYRDVVQFKCKSDYTRNGTDTIVCSKDATFQPAPPSCIYVECKDPKIANATWHSGARPPYRHNSFVIFKCNPGFEMEGSDSITCLLNSTWSAKPVCKEIVPPTVKATTTVTTPTSTKAVPADVTPKPPVPPPDVTPEPTAPPHNHGYRVVLIVVGAGGAVVIAIIIWYFVRKRQNRQKLAVPGDDGLL